MLSGNPAVFLFFKQPFDVAGTTLVDHRVILATCVGTDSLFPNPRNRLNSLELPESAAHVKLEVCMHTYRTKLGDAEIFTACPNVSTDPSADPIKQLINSHWRSITPVAASGFLSSCYDRGFKCLGEFMKTKGRNKMKIMIPNTSLRATAGKGCEQPMTDSKPILMLAFLILSILIATSGLMAQESDKPPMAHETITPLITKDLAGSPGEQALMYTVDFPPGFSSPIHRHNAQVSVYVLEGSVVMQVRGGKEVTLGPGQSFYEDPKDIHVVSRNASSTEPAKFLVFLINKKGAPLVIPAN
jgi:quercetin dioxygenase-like cupin family protein